MTNYMKCKKCFNGNIFFAPDLRASGYSSPKDYICPVCGTYHSSNGDIYKEKDFKQSDRNKPIDGVDSLTIYQ